jgi:ribonuclease HI
MNRFGVRNLEEFRARLSELRLELAPPTEAGSFVAYTDGACLGNPEGPGGWAAAVFAEPSNTQWLLFGHLSSTSNNRAEALGVLGALEWVPPRSRLAVRADSQLTVRQLTGEYKVKSNIDIWAVIRDTITSKELRLSPEWVRGHVGNPLNELADRLANLGAHNGDISQLDAAVPPPRVELTDLQPATDWERDFVASVQDQLRRGRALTQKQQAVVDRIRARKV